MIRVSGSALIVVGAIVVGAFLRLWNLDAAQFRGDDFAISTLARDIVHQGALPAGVTASIAVAHGPAAPFILALPAAISEDHQWLAVSVGLSNTAMIPVAYLVGRDLFGRQAGVLAAILIAVNPWLVVAGRRLWLNAFMAPSALLLIWALLRAQSTRKSRAWALAGAALSLNAQVHLSSVLNFLAYGSMFALGRRAPIRKLALGGCVALVFLLPWVALSVVPDLLRFNPTTARSSAPSEDSALERATLIVTGVAYQSVAGQSGQLLDATGLPFTVTDALARGLATAAWGALLVWAWRHRTGDPRVAALCLAMALMIFLPLAALLGPSLAGPLPAIYPYYFLNALPPLLLAMGALCSLLSRVFMHLGSVLVTLIAVAQLVVAAPFFMTHDQYWPLGGYGVAWKYTHELVETTRALASSERAPIMVGGEEIEDNEQASVTARLLKRKHEPTRLFDGRDGIVSRESDGPVYEVTINDGHTLTKLLRRDFADREVFTQTLPGAGWTRRVFRVPPDEIARWGQMRLPFRPTAPQSEAVVVYERAGIVPVDARRGGPYVGVQWHFDSDPSEPFLTDVILYEGDREVLRQVHVAYPAASWQRGDWYDTRMLNLFELPPEFQLGGRGSIGFEHRGILSGRRLSPPVRLGPTIS